MTRRGWIIAMVVPASLFATSFAAIAVFDPLPRIMWNATASTAVGLYEIEPERDPPVGELVAVAPPPSLARWLSARGYLPEGVPLLKHVTAKSGQRLCRVGVVVSVDARPVAIARLADGRGRSLPVWQGCRTLSGDELLLLNAHPDSMDGRYFGPLPASTVLGRATPILTRDTPGAPLTWRSARR